VSLAVLCREGLHHFENTLDLLILASSDSLGIKVQTCSQLVSSAHKHWSLYLLELWQNPRLFLILLKTSFPQHFIFISGLILGIVIVIIFVHYLEEEGQDLAAVFDVREQKHVCSEIIVIIQSLHVLSKFLARSEFIGLLLDVLALEVADVNEVVFLA